MNHRLATIAFAAFLSASSAYDHHGGLRTATKDDDKRIDLQKYFEEHPDRDPHGQYKHYHGEKDAEKIEQYKKYFEEHPDRDPHKQYHHDKGVDFFDVIDVADQWGPSDGGGKGGGGGGGGGPSKGGGTVEKGVKCEAGFDKKKGVGKKCEGGSKASFAAKGGGGRPGDDDVDAASVATRAAGVLSDQIVDAVPSGAGSYLPTGEDWDAFVASFADEEALADELLEHGGRGKKVKFGGVVKVEWGCEVAFKKAEGGFSKESKCGFKLVQGMGPAPKGEYF